MRRFYAKQTGRNLPSNPIGREVCTARRIYRARERGEIELQYLFYVNLLVLSGDADDG